MGHELMYPRLIYIETETAVINIKERLRSQNVNGIGNKEDIDPRQKVLLSNFARHVFSSLDGSFIYSLAFIYWLCLICIKSHNPG